VRSLAAIACVLLSGVGAARAADASPPATPAAAVEAFQAALVAKNREAALALLDPKVVIFESGGAELSRDDYASHHLGADMEFVAATQTEITSRESGANGEVAWVLTRSKTIGTFRGKEISSVGTETMLLVRGAKGAWRIVHIHWSSHAAEK
jgi:ketosteroid isomerase-like protein